ncbi:dTDP-4-dehydrorhamnose reductase [Candidatus Falkowbacteria bacterium RIFOXYC2_FULL_47_12]|uniref:dTDP-4-dehydrorhamnose reductase n=2 Tax=Candidatus Falkowiibacteriota TaxID=1752728 RepID=A0A1F5TRU2_9BACT|nr:MAG: dTDP-4-dehydrorhamnose reductase [Candidatus Falkowbacteria bacterium RIFOXYA2_FULL_47_9]OGF41321.1 MAG: dTDP-4-dehydrorhamnose reductase [Candidatus Falkowbacteria bacterium RIFOXYC2_FULL_47_12]
MENILVIGSHGMLGQEMLKVFPDAVGWDREDINIVNKTQVKEKIKELQPNLVINCAAYNAVDDCENEAGFALAKKINGEALGYLADVCLELKTTLVHYSTNYVFDGEEKQGYAEDAAPNPISKYGKSKLLGEQEMLRRPNLKYYLIRTSKLFGRKGNSELAKKNFFDAMIKLSEKKRELKVVDEELSNFTYAPDLAHVTKELLNGKYQSGIYHIINEQPATWYQAAETLFDMLGKNVTLIPVSADEFPRLAKRPRNGILLNTKLPRLRNYEEALSDYLNK